jgi:hypothetical protein
MTETTQEQAPQQPNVPIDVTVLQGRVNDLQSEVAALQTVVHQMAAQLVQRGWFHNVENTVVDWYQRLMGRKS